MGIPPPPSLPLNRHTCEGSYPWIEMMVEMLLAEIRKESGLTQVDLAQALGIKQPSLSKLESQDDMQISTLRRIIQALSGELELVARMPRGTIRLRQFKDDLQPA